MYHRMMENYLLSSIAVGPVLGLCAELEHVYSGGAGCSGGAALPNLGRPLQQRRAATPASPPWAALTCPLVYFGKFKCAD